MKNEMEKEGWRSGKIEMVKRRKKEKTEDETVSQRKSTVQKNS